MEAQDRLISNALNYGASQAKLAYEAGLKEGRREVVEWLENNWLGGTEHYLTLDGRKWQAQLKAWGIEEEKL